MDDLKSPELPLLAWAKCKFENAKHVQPLEEDPPGNWRGSASVFVDTYRRVVLGGGNWWLARPVATSGDQRQWLKQMLDSPVVRDNMAVCLQWKNNQLIAAIGTLSSIDHTFQGTTSGYKANNLTQCIAFDALVRDWVVLFPIRMDSNPYLMDLDPDAVEPRVCLSPAIDETLKFSGLVMSPAFANRRREWVEYLPELANPTSLPLQMLVASDVAEGGEPYVDCDIVESNDNSQLKVRLQCGDKNTWTVCVRWREPRIVSRTSFQPTVSAPTASSPEPLSEEKVPELPDPSPPTPESGPSASLNLTTAKEDSSSESPRDEQGSSPRVSGQEAPPTSSASSSTKDPPPETTD